MNAYLYPQATQHHSQYQWILLWFFLLYSNNNKKRHPPNVYFPFFFPPKCHYQKNILLTVTTRNICLHPILAPNQAYQASQGFGKENLSKWCGPCVCQSCNTTSLYFEIVGNRDFCLIQMLLRFQIKKTELCYTVFFFSFELKFFLLQFNFSLSRFLLLMKTLSLYHWGCLPLPLARRGMILQGTVKILYIIEKEGQRRMEMQGVAWQIGREESLQWDKELGARCRSEGPLGAASEREIRGLCAYVEPWERWRQEPGRRTQSYLAMQKGWVNAPAPASAQGQDENSLCIKDSFKTCPNSSQLTHFKTVWPKWVGWAGRKLTNIRTGTGGCQRGSILTVAPVWRAC